MAKYNGYPSWNAWNVCLWIDNEQGLYWACYDIAQQYKAKILNHNKTVEAIMDTFRHWFGEKTPDGAPISKRACKIWLSHHSE